MQTPQDMTDGVGADDRGAPPQAWLYRFATAAWNEATGRLSVDGEDVRIEPRPLRLLAELLRRPGEVLTAEELQQLVWDGRPTVPHVLSSAVNRLRKALGEPAAQHIVTVPRLGYKFEGPLQVQPLQAGSVLPPSLQAGQPVPGREAYVLVRPLGEERAGGSVWLARHGKLGSQRVFKFADSAARLASLKREFNLYRVLRHELGPRRDFAAVVDCNFSVAPYFLECEWGGTSLHDWVAQDGGQALERLGVQQRLALFLQAADALAAAHRVGVLHKDIKPGNILVEADPSPEAAAATGGWQLRLTDLGSGHILDPQTLRALHGTLAELRQTAEQGRASPSGTPLYLAPELLAGEPASEQSDLYALGLVLYQVLVGDMTRPLAGGWERDVTDPLLREDIAAATDGRPAARLKHVSDLAERLRTLPQRHAAREAAAREAAAAAAAAAELRQARARRPWAVALLASLAGGLVLSLWLGQQTRTALAAAKAETAKASAIQAFLRDDLLGGMDTGRVGQGATVSMREVLDRASARAGQRLQAQPEVQGEVRGQLAHLNYTLSQFGPADTEYDQAITLLQASRPAADPQLLQLRYERVRNGAVHNRLKEATEWLQAADADAGAQLQQPGVLALTAASARTALLISQGQGAQALPEAERTVALADALADDPGRAQFTSRIVLGDLLYRVGRFADAERVLAQAMPETLDARDVGPVRLARAQVVRGRVLLQVGRGAEAERLLLAARDTLLQRLGPGEQYVGVAEATLAAVYDAAGNFDQARQTYQRVYDRFVAAQGAEHPSSRVMALNLAISELNQGRAATALRRLDEGRAWFVQYMGGDTGPVVQAVDFARAQALTGVGRAAQAVPILQSLDPLVLTQATPAKDWAWRLQAERGRALIAAGRRDEGLALVRQAMQPMSEHGTPAWVLGGYQRLLR